MDNDQKNLIYKIIFVLSIGLNLFFVGKYFLANIDKMTLLLSKTRAAPAPVCAGCVIDNKCFFAGGPGDTIGKVTYNGPDYCCWSAGKGARSQLNFNHPDPCNSTSAPTPPTTPTPVPQCRASSTQNDVVGLYGTRWCNKCDAKISYGECSKGTDGVFYRCVGPNSATPPVPEKYKNLKYNIFVPDDANCKTRITSLPVSPLHTSPITITVTPTSRLSATTTPKPPTLTESLASLVDFNNYCLELDTDSCLKMGCNGVGLEADSVTSLDECVSYYTSGNNCDQNEEAKTNLFIDAKRCVITVKGY